MKNKPITLAEIVVGSPGAGKTTYVKTRLLNNPKPGIIFDASNEYGVGLPYGKNPRAFLEYALDVNHKCIVFEEATAFFSTAGVNLQMIELLVTRRHLYNDVYLVFHSVRGIPIQIFDYCNYLTIFRTNDSIRHLERRFGDDHPVMRIDPRAIPPFEARRVRLV